jgi:hypothetical protein
MYFIQILIISPFADIDMLKTNSYPFQVSTKEDVCLDMAAACKCPRFRAL